MDLRFTADELAFRDEVRRFVAVSLPEPLKAKAARGRTFAKEDVVAWTRILNAKGWAAPHWPVEWGGTGWDPIRQHIFLDTLQQSGAPQLLSFGVNMVGPVIIAFGSDAQKRRFLPRIANLDDWWCQGFSEPGAGSDLASLRTAARRDGDHYVVNGQKTWTTMAQHADWIFCLVRTDPAARRQEGISFLLIDMRSPGIAVRPIQTIDGGFEINEVFLDDVRVPAENLVGAENKGWDYAKFLLGNERTGIARVGQTKEWLRRIRRIAAQERDGEGTMMDNRRFREKLTAIEVELKALEVTLLRVVAGARARDRGKPDPASSILKLKGSELQQATSELLLEVVGPYAMPFQPQQDDGWNEPPIGPDWAATAAPAYFNYRKVSIYGGSNEIQKTIVAKAILGL